MPLGIINNEWLDTNGQRAYPLTVEATKTDISGTIAIPDSFIVELYFPVATGQNVEPDRFFLRSLGIFPTGYNIAIGYDDDTANPPLVASVNIAASSHTDNLSYILAGSGDFGDSTGTITIGRLDDIALLPPGQYLFTPAGGMLEPDVIRPILRGISAITVINGLDRSEPLYGDIELVAGTNIRLIASTSGGQPKITISAISGEGLNEDCECENGQPEGPCIKTINGIAPASNGNFKFVGDPCITIAGIASGLSFADSCSSPCCGCEELDALRDQLTRFNDAKHTLETFVSRLGAEVTTMRDVVLGSRLGDTGCST